MYGTKALKRSTMNLVFVFNETKVFEVLFVHVLMNELHLVTSLSFLVVVKSGDLS